MATDLTFLFVIFFKSSFFVISLILHRDHSYLYSYFVIPCRRCP